MDGTGRNQNEMENKPQWDNTYGKRSLPQINTTYGVQNTLCEEQKQPEQSMADKISSFEPPVQPYLPQEKKRKKGIFIALGVVLALLLICIGAGYLAHRSAPVYKIRKGFENMDKEWAQMRNPLSEKLDADELKRMMAEDGSHVKTRLNFAMDTYGMGSVTLGIDTDYQKDVRHKELDARTSLSVMNYEFAHFNLYGDEDALCFSIPELFLEDVYIETEDVTGQYNKSMWADSYLFGEMEEEYSIDLFADIPQYESVHSWQDVREYLGKSSEHLETCLTDARLERAGKGIYRVTFDALEVNYLLQDLLQAYEDMTGQDMYDLMSCLQLVSMGDDISLLIKIDQKGVIRRIVLEDPVSILDNQIKMEGEILFNGQKRSIDLLQGEITFTRYDGDENLEIIWQVDQWIDSAGDEYQVEADMKCKAMDEEMNLKYKGTYDAVYDEFVMNFSMKDDWTVCNIYGNGRFDNIRPGCGYEMDLEEFSLELDGEELFKLSGDIMVEPLRGEIRRSAKARKAFFQMTEEDWYEILDRIDEEYGSLLDMMW